MAIIYAEDDYQQQTIQRNNELIEFLSGREGVNIIRIWRDPEPTNPPDVNGPKRGTWYAETK